ncbi:hypothetical protein MPTK1_8g18550 [Marchantia polymorpha subsp. ruderalis]|uniref:Uncharacterized protein n=1 Tax=Marchantia polymorpha TaxID=3197 RepID=A0A2R6W142_MARPO|nr:hypothetical protein MARPO_0192s0006 [Marchantia polymorpha]BBN20369.1 hypothetical protein Mp_8g18550 [Marchantia polymorpha subsp. ruderalis]|eukprot:PTQ27571.1 hypothetical protein MARPO_0192s0006 [Marchantia polymorpha]
MAFRRAERCPRSLLRPCPRLTSLQPTLRAFASPVCEIEESSSPRLVSSTNLPIHEPKCIVPVRPHPSSSSSSSSSTSSPVVVPSQSSWQNSPRAHQQSATGQVTKPSRAARSSAPDRRQQQHQWKQQQMSSSRSRTNAHVRTNRSSKDEDDERR